MTINKPLVEKACRVAKRKNSKIVPDLSSYNVVEASLNDFIFNA